MQKAIVRGFFKQWGKREHYERLLNGKRLLFSELLWNLRRPAWVPLAVVLVALIVLIEMDVCAARIYLILKGRTSKTGSYDGTLSAVRVVGKEVAELPRVEIQTGT